MKMLLHTLALGLAITSFTASAQSVSRVESMSVYNYMNGSYVIDDSAKYFYSNTNPGTATWQVLETTLGKQAGYQDWYSANNAMLYDSAQIYYNNALYATYTQTLSGNKIIARILGFSTPVNESFTYNSNNLLTESIEIKTVLVKTNWYYNSNNQIDSILYYTPSTNTNWFLSSTLYHTYTGGKLTKMLKVQLVNDTSYNLFEYDVNGYVSKSIIMHGLDTHYVYSYVNAANGNVMEYRKRSRTQYIPTLGPMQNWEWHKYTYNNLNNKATDLTLYWDNNTQVWDTFMNGTYSYNAQNQLEKFQSLHWNSSTQAWEPHLDTATSLIRKARIVNYYYETVWPAGIATHDVQNEAMNIFPVPAASMVNIYVPLKEKQEINAAIVNMEGRVIRTWKAAATKEYRTSITISDLPAGNYLLQVNGMAKQFVVR